MRNGLGSTKGKPGSLQLKYYKETAVETDISKMSPIEQEQFISDGNRWLKTTGPHRGEVYRHYKGGLYGNLSFIFVTIRNFS